MSEQLLGALIGLGGALFGAIVAVGLGVWTQGRSEKRHTAEEFRGILEKLVDARAETIRIWQEHAQDVLTKEGLSSAVNNKRQLYKSTARQMVEEVASGLTANDFMTLGFEHQQDSEIDTAQVYYHRALIVAKEDELERVTALRYLGTLFLSPTIHHDRSKAEEYYREAVEITHGKTDDYSRYTTGYTHEQWALALAVNRYPESKGHFGSARENYEAMSATNPLRASALEALDLRLSRLTQGLSVAPAPARPAEPQASTLTEVSGGDGPEPSIK